MLEEYVDTAMEEGEEKEEEMRTVKTLILMTGSD
jgi:hypothetical protein